MRARVVIALALACAPGILRAQPAPDEPPPAEPAPQPPPEPPPPPPAPPALTGPTVEELEQRIDELERKQEELERAEARNQGTREQVSKEILPRSRLLSVFVDVGAFVVQGNGSGIRSDLDHIYYPQYGTNGTNHVPGQWVFTGDPLATAINSLGEPADNSDSRELKTDNLGAGGNPSLIVNSIGLAIGQEVGHRIWIASLAELLPRPGGDILDVELAHVDWQPYEDKNFWISIGKVDSVLGVEYRSQDAPRRLGVAPSLICRYTCGRPLGIEARFVQGALSASGAITDGDSFMNRFEPATVLHASSLPSASGHLQWMLPVGQGLELGVSGATGPQDKQADLSLWQWHVGFDASLHDLDGFDLVAEYVQGLEQGQTTSPIVSCNAAPCLTYKGAYLLASRRVNNWLTPYVRVDWRDAVHQNGATFVYESHVARATIGAHFELTNRILAKVEYTFVRELDNIPDFPDDVLTSSIVVATE